MLHEHIVPLNPLRRSKSGSSFKPSNLEPRPAQTDDVEVGIRGFSELTIFPRLSSVFGSHPEYSDDMVIVT
jgi:hypothetical protein